MKTLTVFTPTFNRAYCLQQLYDSLCRQTIKDFCWLIVDDGSIDNTRELVNDWRKEKKIELKYVYQKNQGMHGAHNTAYENINTELNVCIDSDDFMTDDAVEKIINFWKINGSKEFSGIIALDAKKNGDILGTKLPNSKSTTLKGYYRNGGKGDKKLIYRTEIMKRYPKYPIFEGEKYVGLGYKYILAEQDYELLIMNEVVCVVEYLEDGSSLNMLSQYKKNPKGFTFLRREKMKYAFNRKELFREAIHYVSSSIMSKDYSFLSKSPSKIMTIIAIPFGILLNVYIKLKVKK